MRSLLFAANWKMHLGPAAARTYIDQFLTEYKSQAGRRVWFFPPATTLHTVAQEIAGREDLAAGAQDVHWEPKGPFTGEISVPLAVEAGARAALIGHSERRHVFGETEAETGLKVRAVLGGDLVPVLCVGEKLEQREAGETLAVVQRQLTGGLEGLAPEALHKVIVAYEPVWAIGTGKNATPRDAAQVHAAIRAWLKQRGATSPVILYGGSVNLKNIAELLAERELDGVLVGGASLEAATWLQLVSTPVS